MMKKKVEKVQDVPDCEEYSVDMAFLERTACPMVKAPVSLQDYRVIYAICSENVAKCQEKLHLLGKYLKTKEEMEKIVCDNSEKARLLREKEPTCFMSDRDFIPGSNIKKPDKKKKDEVTQIYDGYNRLIEKQKEEIEKWQSSSWEVVHTLEIDMLVQSIFFQTPISGRVKDLDQVSFEKMAHAFCELFEFVEKHFGREKMKITQIYSAYQALVSGMKPENKN
jgi:hypothetical protein